MLSIELNDLIKQIIKTKAESQTIEVKPGQRWNNCIRYR